MLQAAPAPDSNVVKLGAKRKENAPAGKAKGKVAKSLGKGKK
jgi:hypothetical protein